jgi:hypothetical protein
MVVQGELMIMCGVWARNPGLEGALASPHRQTSGPGALLCAAASHAPGHGQAGAPA